MRGDRTVDGGRPTWPRLGATFLIQGTLPLRDRQGVACMMYGNKDVVVVVVVVLFLFVSMSRARGCLYARINRVLSHINLKAMM